MNSRGQAGAGWGAGGGELESVEAHEKPQPRSGPARFPPGVAPWLTRNQKKTISAMVARRLGKTNWSAFRHGRADDTKLPPNVSGRRTFRARGIYQDLESRPGEDRGRPPENETSRRRREVETMNENENTTKLELRTIDRIH